MSTLDAIRERVEELAGQIGAPPDSLPTFGRSEDARPHIEVERDGRMAWVVDERGAEIERRATLDRDELLYWTFESVTWLMAYQEARGAPGDDFRRLLFTRQLELLGQLKSQWRDRVSTEKAQYLREVGMDAEIP
jgi:hypothetical protein